jgi:ABC-type nickel/cobalt efflux system permease component RcnA
VTRRLAHGLRAAALAFAIAAIPSLASAHPLGNFSINHYAAVTVGPTEVRVDLVIDAAEIPTVAAIAELDRDADGAADTAELDAARITFCEARAADVEISLDSRSVRLSVEEASLALRPGAEGLQTLRAECGLAGTLDTPIASSASVAIADRGDADRLGWREIVVRGNGVTVKEADAERDVSHRLTTYPDDLLQTPLNERETTVGLLLGGPRQADATTPETIIGDEGPTAPATPVAVVAGLALAAIAGAGHALSPGHGKTLMAAYLVGSRGRRRDAVLLGVGVTASHTIGVVALAGLVLVAGTALPAERLYPVLSAVAGAAVVAIGTSMLVSCVRRLAANRSHAAAHAHGHTHHYGRDHDGHDPQVATTPGRAGILAIALAGGLVPSPTALLLLLGAVAAGEPAYGLALAVAFGSGMAAALTGIGLLVVGGRDLVSGLGNRLPAARRLGALVPWAASAAVLVGGVVLTGQAVIGWL